MTPHAHTQPIALYNTYLSRAALVLTFLCTLSVFLYGIFLLMAVVHTASRTAAERHINTLSAGMGDAEMSYLTAQKALTPERAKALGFVAPVKVSSVYATAAAHTLTINENR